MDSVPPTSSRADLCPLESEGGAGVYRLRIVLAVLWIFVIMILCWIPGTMVREIESESGWFKIPNLDKVVHAGIFLVFSILCARVVTSRWRFGWIVLGGVGLAILTEMVQRLAVIRRDGSVADAAVDVVGVVVGLLAAPLVEPVARRVESRLFPSAGVSAPPPLATAAKVEGAARSSS